MSWLNCRFFVFSLCVVGASARLLAQSLSIGAPKGEPPGSHSERKNSGPFPFDQRTVLLAQSAGTQLPDDKAIAQILDAFVFHGRIRFVGAPGSEKLPLPIQVPRDFMWSSGQAVRNLGLRHRSDGILQLIQEGARLQLTWYSTLDGLPLFVESVALPASSGDSQEETERRRRLQNLVAGIWKRIPGQGYVTGRTVKTLRLEGAQTQSLKPGTRLRLLRITGVQRHPLLKTLTRVDFSPSGEAVLERVLPTESLAVISFESLVDPIEVGDRYEVLTEDLENQKVAESQNAESSKTNSSGSVTKIQEEDAPWDLGKIAELGVRPLIGRITHQQEVSGQNYSMKTWEPGVEALGKIFLTPEWLIEGGLQFHFFRFRKPPEQYSSPGPMSSGSSQQRLSGAYRVVYLQETSESPPGELLFQFGYRRVNFKMPVLDSALAPTALNFSGFEAGLGGTLPLLPRAVAFLQFYRMFGASLRESPQSTGSSSQNSVWEFSAGGRYLWDDARTFLIGGLKIDSATAQMKGSGTRSLPASAQSFRQSQLFVGYSYSF